MEVTVLFSLTNDLKVIIILSPLCLEGYSNSFSKWFILYTFVFMSGQPSFKAERWTIALIFIIRIHICICCMWDLLSVEGMLSL